MALSIATAACVDAAGGGSLPSDERAPAIAVGLRDGSEFQQRILADEVVSRSEYERAFDAAVSCMRDEGLNVVGPFSIMSDRYLTYTVQFTEESDLIADACDEEYLGFVRRVWSWQQTPTGAEAEEARLAYLECVQSAGVTVEDNATYAEIDEIAAGELDASTEACIERYSTNTFIVRTSGQGG